MEENRRGPGELSRRQFLKASGGLALGLGALHGAQTLGFEPALASRTLVPLAQQGNPLES